jgi:hypothetical protein
MEDKIIFSLDDNLLKLKRELLSFKSSELDRLSDIEKDRISEIFKNLDTIMTEIAIREKENTIRLDVPKRLEANIKELKIKEFEKYEETKTQVEIERSLEISLKELIKAITLLLIH